MRILLAEDDEALGIALEKGLKQNGYSVYRVTDGHQAIQFGRSNNFDLIILDIGLPKASGLIVIRNLRHEKISTPILILTARADETIVAQSLDMGADDYMTKPFSIIELYARLRALQRRLLQRTTPLIQFGYISLDPAAHSVTVAGNVVKLSLREFVLLQKLLENPGQVLTRASLEESMYGWDTVDSNALEVHIHHLRKKIGANFIRTIRGVGYIADKLP